MIRYELICILLLTLCYYTVGEGEQKDTIEQISNENKQQDKLVLQLSEPYRERRNDTSFTLRLATRLFPSHGYSENSIDSTSAAGGYSGPRYLPPPSVNQYHVEDCNRCNQEPWIPMASNIGHQTVISFIPPMKNIDFSSHSSGLASLRPPLPSYGTPLKQYGLPVQFRPKKFPYQVKLQTGHEQILSGQNIESLPDHDEIIIVDYMIPPPLNYKIPSLLYGPPKNSNGPLKSIYGPPKPIYGPPKQIYGQAKPIYGPPKPVYGPPKPIYGPPQPFYGPPKPLYGHPPKPVYSPPSGPIYEQLPFEPYDSSQIYNKDGHKQNGPSTFLTSFQPPPIEPHQYGAPHNDISTTYLHPVAESYNTQVPSFPKPPIIDNNYGTPPQSLDYNPTLSSTLVDESTNKYTPPAVPSDSYGAPVTGDSLDYLTPTEQLSLPSGNSEHLEKPIPLPNLSSIPIVPLYNFGEFKRDFSNPQRSSNSEEIHNAENDVEIQKSVKIADYLATIEHPINVIQSPIVELNIKDDVQEEFDYNLNVGNESANTGNIISKIPVNLNSKSNSQTQNLYKDEQYIYNHDEGKTYNNINEKLHDSNFNRNEESSLNLSENPIIVEDIHTAASNVNNSFIDLKETPVKRTNDKELSVLTVNKQKTEQIESSGINLIKDILLKQENLESRQKKVNYIKKIDHIPSNKSEFTTPSLDFSDWQPSYAGIFPAPVVSQPPGRVNFTTKKPKQIIIPYINKKSGQFHNDWSYKDQDKFSAYNKDVYTTLLPVYTPPSSTEVSIWSKFMDDFNLAESKRIAATAFAQPTTAVYNIRDLLTQPLSYDVLSLQKNIDDWTQQAYSSKTIPRAIKKSTEKLLTSKKIPDEYFTTQSIKTMIETVTDKNGIFDQYSAAPTKNESFIRSENNDIEANLIESDTTTEPITTSVSSTKPPFPSPFSPKGQRSLWDISHTTISPLTKEKVYVVTPQTYNFYTSTPASAWSMAPKIENGKINNASTYDTHKFSIRVEPENKTRGEKVKKDFKNAVKIIYSEWPHLINNLQTTTLRSTSQHPLFGLMDIAAYTPRPNATVETIAGHSQVAPVTTPIPAPKNETTEIIGGKKIT